MFTDADLKRLKEHLDGDTMPVWPRPSFKALLARLEAAEKVCELVGKNYIANDNVLWEAQGVDYMEKWRKAVGK